MTVEFFSLEAIQALARQYGYWTVFGGIALENAGIPLPGETITLVGGFLAGSGELDYRWVLASAIAGAVLGDNGGYWLGRLGGWPLLLRLGRCFRFSEAQLAGARQQFADNAARAVFFGRFVALLRIFAGPMAGIVQMPYWQFLACNLAGAALWAAIMVTLADVVGQLMPLSQLVAWVAQFSLLALFGILVWLFLPTGWHRRRQQAEANSR